MSESSFENVQIEGTALESLFRDHPEMAASFAENYHAWAQSVDQHGKGTATRLLRAIEYTSYAEIFDSHFPWMAQLVNASLEEGKMPLILTDDATSVSGRPGSVYYYGRSIYNMHPTVELLPFVRSLDQSIRARDIRKYYSLFIFDDIIGSGLQMFQRLSGIEQLSRAGRLPVNMEVTIAVIRTTTNGFDVVQRAAKDLEARGVKVNIISAGIARSFREIFPDLIPKVKKLINIKDYQNTLALEETFTIFGNSCPDTTSSIFTRDPALFEIRGFVKAY